MQIYKVIIPESVRDRIDEQAIFIAQDKPGTVFEWFDHIYEQIETLQQNPQRCPKAPESQYTDVEIRQLLIGNCRVLFSSNYSAQIPKSFIRF